MLPGIQQTVPAEEKRLRTLYREMNEQDRATLMRFAEFLSASPSIEEAVMQVFPEPEITERPAEESVVKAIKRLSAAYHMVERDRLLNETSSLMSAHVLQGRPAPDVIDELEALFARHYADMKTEFEQNS